VRRERFHRPAPVQALSYQVLATVCGQDIQPVDASRGTRWTTNPCELD